MWAPVRTRAVIRVLSALGVWRCEGRREVVDNEVVVSLLRSAARLEFDSALTPLYNVQAAGNSLLFFLLVSLIVLTEKFRVKISLLFIIVIT